MDSEASDDRISGDTPESSSSPSAVRAKQQVSEFDVVDLVCEARAHALRVLSDLSDREAAESISRLMIARGAVVAIRDSGGVSYAPVNMPRMRLAQRVASLFVADYLNASFDYRDARVCRVCGSLILATTSSSANACCARRDSHVSGCEVGSDDSDVALESA